MTKPTAPRKGIRPLLAHRTISPILTGCLRITQPIYTSASVSTTDGSAQFSPLQPLNLLRGPLRPLVPSTADSSCVSACELYTTSPGLELPNVCDRDCDPIPPSSSGPANAFLSPTNPLTRRSHRSRHTRSSSGLTPLSPTTHSICWRRSSWRHSRYSSRPLFSARWVWAAALASCFLRTVLPPVLPKLSASSTSNSTYPWAAAGGQHLDLCGWREAAAAHLDLMSIFAVPPAAFEVPPAGGALGACLVPREAAIVALCHGVEVMMLRRYATGVCVLRFEVQGLCRLREQRSPCLEGSAKRHWMASFQKYLSS